MVANALVRIYIAASYCASYLRGHVGISARYGVGHAGHPLIFGGTEVAYLDKRVRLCVVVAG